MLSEKPIVGNSLGPHRLCLTFDDGPGPRTLEIATYLAEERIPATFFVVGQWALEQAADVASLLDLGHVIGNHSFSHPHLTDSYLSSQDLVEELDWPLGRPGETKLFRPPYGAWSPRLAQILNRDRAIYNGYIGPVNWDVGGFDYEYWRKGKNPEACARAYEREVRKRPKRNGIVLLHDHTADQATNGPQSNQTPELVRLLIPRLRALGCEFVALGELRELGRPRVIAP